MTAQIEPKKKYLLITVPIIMVILISATLITQKLITSFNSTHAKLQEFSEKIAAGEYTTAKEVLQALEQAIQSSGDPRPDADLKQILDNRLLELEQLYAENSLDSETLLNEYKILKEFGFPLNHCDKYEAIINASTLISSSFYDEAIQSLETLLQTCPQDKLLTEKLQEFQQEKETKLVPYSGPISHIFFHPLIAYPELAFDNDSMSKGYDDYFTTVKEFTRILDALYQRNYILIDINSIYEKVEVDGKQIIREKILYLPQGKKPIVLSIDDLNYYEYMIQNGNVYKLILDENGNVATYSLTPDGQENVAYDNEIVPILDAFVQKHPDFSFQGAKGVIALTGYEGILGYRTNELDAPTFTKEKEEALTVVKRLKETGWTFASHGYGHPHMAKISYNRLVSDTTKWKNEVESLVGPTKVLIFPYGESVLPPDPKFRYLLEEGFEVICGVGSAPYTKFSSDYVFMDRRHLDGIAFKTQAHHLEDLFDSTEIIDEVRPK